MASSGPVPQPLLITVTRVRATNLIIAEFLRILYEKLNLTPGTRLGVYEVTAQIGEGGMGQVYRATDTKLKRQVAIKILPAPVAGLGAAIWNGIACSANCQVPSAKWSGEWLVPSGGQRLGLGVNPPLVIVHFKLHLALCT